MATNKHAVIRYEALDRCFSNKGRKFFIDDLIRYVSEALTDYTGKDSSISRRQILKDMDFSTGPSTGTSIISHPLRRAIGCYCWGTYCLWRRCVSCRCRYVSVCWKRLRRAK